MSRSLSFSLPGLSAPVVAAAVVAVGGLGLTASGAWAGLQADAFNTAPLTVTSGTLSLTLADNGAGFTTAISNMAPGDVVQRYVDLTNGGTLAAQNITLAVTGSGNTLLTTSATKGLAVTVKKCTGGTWTPGTAVCSGSTSTLIASTPIASYGTAISMVSGAIAVNAVQNLQVSISLPDQNETTTNGVTPGGTIQGLSTGLTFTFTEAQRTATTTTS